MLVLNPLSRKAGEGRGGGESHWQTTLWAMVGIQFIMTMSFSFLSPIMPLFLPDLGVTT